jgi:hypothetical protein
MENGSSINKEALYDQCRRLAIRYVGLMEFEKAQEILTVMVKSWPERVIAKGRAISSTEVPDAKLDSTPPVP